jgi:hypothetical protein
MIIAESDESSNERVDTSGPPGPSGGSRSRSGAQMKRLHLDGSGVEANGDSGFSMDVETGAGTAYVESMVSTDGFTRGANGRIKFNKDTKKRRRVEADFADGMEVDELATNAASGAKSTQPNKKLKEKKNQKKLGHEFKAKVRFTSPFG